MRVRITKRGDESLVVKRLDMGGGFGAGKISVVQPGEKWEGWKYSRLLHQYGEGEHFLLTKEEQRQNET